MTETGGTVLIADDDADLRALYRAWLPAAYELRLAVDGRDALDRVTDNVDVVVLDRKMPRMRGEAVAMAIAEREVDPAVVMISSIEPDENVVAGTVDRYLQKPIGRKAFVEAIDDAIATERDRPKLSVKRHSPAATESP